MTLPTRCARDSDWCDGTTCREFWGIDCPNADPGGTPVRQLWRMAPRDGMVSQAEAEKWIVTYRDLYTEENNARAAAKAERDEARAEAARLREALEQIAEQFCPGEERRTYNPDITLVLDRIRATAREALDSEASS